MIEYRTGDLFESGADYLVCPVNCVGTMGKGLALAFKDRYPRLDDVYQGALRYGKLTTQEPYLVFPRDNEPSIVLFATKWHWREPSDIIYIKNGLRNLKNLLIFWEELDPEDIDYSIALPKLGCGLGGLEWSEVRMEIEHYLGDLKGRVYVYE